ncbi:MAG: M24 family metallopeptidase [Anaerolineae bacterium]|nr:M24 family metallopeptidase [Anaerolineae bacterium]
MQIDQNPTSSELDNKLERLRDLLRKFDLDALALRQIGNFAWATCGGDSHVDIASSTGVAALLITRSARFLVTNNIESARLMEEQGLARQGWDLQVSPWFAGEAGLLKLTRGLKLGADLVLPEALDLSHEIAGIRCQLLPEERNRFRALGKECAQGMYAAAHSITPGMTEYEIAGQLAQAVESRGVQVIVNLIATDERVFSYRHPLPTAKKLRNYAMLVLCGRKWGLICSLTRLVHFGAVPDEVQRKAEAVARVDAEMIAATRPGKTIGEVFTRGLAAYASVGYADEWMLHHQGGLAGYAPREVVANAESKEPVLVGQAFAWNPSITGVKSEDTLLVGEQTNEIITEMDDWLAVDIPVGDQLIKRPAILVR